MEENRSFDHYFGTLSGVRGFADPSVLIQPNGRPVFYQADPNNPDGYLLPWHLDTQVTGAQAIPSTSHAWTVQHEAWNGGLMDSWFTAHIPADGAVNAQFVMGYYEREDVPYHFALAEAFTICDGYHCSLLGPTWPNRMYLMTGWNDPNATGGGPIISNVVPAGGYSWSTYPERLTAAGVSWHVYQEEDDYGCNPLEFFAQYQAAKPGSELYEHGLAISTPGQFERDVANGALPTVSWIIPTSGQSEHPAYIPAAGADFLASKLEALAANPEVWAKTLFILNYDENDGLFDHVPAAGSAGGHAGRVRRRPADWRRHPRAVHPRLPVDRRWLGGERELRPHLGAAAARAGDGRRRAQHQRLAPRDVRELHVGPRVQLWPAVPAAAGDATRLLPGRDRGRDAAGADTTERLPDAAGPGDLTPATHPLG
jgi:phospholipase C